MIQAEIEQNILDCIPHRKPFRFIDEIHAVDDNHIVGSYRFRNDESFYEGHFPGDPITPGVILTECMAQIGLVGFGIHLYGANPETMKSLKVFFTHSDVTFSRIVRPGERVIVKATKDFFRFRRLKCTVEMTTESGELISKGNMSGMFAPMP